MAGDLKALGSGAGKARKAGAIGIGRGRAAPGVRCRIVTQLSHGCFVWAAGLQVRLPPDVPAQALLQVVSNSDASLFVPLATTNDRFRASVTDKAVGHFERGQFADTKAGLLEVQKYTATELLALYGQRWEVEITVKELKVEMRGRQDVLAAQTPETAAQEMAALLLALAVLVEVRGAAAQRGEVAVLRVSFRQTLRLVQALWTLLEIGEGIHSAKQVRALVVRTLERIAAQVTPARRARSCPRAVRQPVGLWPRLLHRQEWQGAIQL